MRGKRQVLVASSIAAVALIAAGAATLTARLSHQAQESRSAELLVARLDEQASRFNALKWQILAQGHWTPEQLELAPQLLGQINQTLTDFVRDNQNGGAFLRLQGTCLRYTAATEGEFHLIAAGKLDRARQLDDTHANPAWNKLQADLSEAARIYQEQAARSLRRQNIGTPLIILFSAGLIALLCWRLERVCRVARVQEALSSSGLVEEAQLRLSAPASSGQRTNWSVEKGTAAGLGVLGVLGVVIAAGSYAGNQSLLATGHWVAHTEQALTNLEGVQAAVNDAEGQCRNYVITGDESYLKSYQSAVFAVYDRSGRLRQLLADDPGQQRRLQLLEQKATERLNLLGKSIDQRRQQGFESAKHVISAGAGRQTMDELRAILSDMRQEEQVLANQRSFQLASEHRLSIIILWLTILLESALLAAIYYLIRKDGAARKATEMVLRAEKQRFEYVVQATSDAVWDWEVSSNRVFWNEGLRRLFGWGSEKAKPNFDFWYECLHPDDRDKVMASLTTTAQSGAEFWSGDFRFRCADGSYADVFARAFLMRDEAGKVLRAIGGMTDVTDRKRNEEAIHESNEKLRAVIRASPLSIWVVDCAGHVEGWNAAAEKMFGWSAAEVLGRTPPFIRKEDKDEASRVMDQLLRGESLSGLELRLQRRDDVFIEISLSAAPLHDSEGRVKGIMALAADISERKRAQAALQESEQRIRLLIDGVKDYAILMLDPEGRVVSWNRGAERISGYSAGEIMGQHFSCFYPAEDVESGKPVQALQTALAEGRVEAEGWRLRKDGSSFWASVVITPVKDPGGNLRGFSKVTRDITERNHAEAAQRGLRVALKTAAEEWRLTFDAIASAIFILDSGDRVIRCNQAALELAGGAPADKVLGCKIMELGSDQPWAAAAEVAGTTRSSSLPASQLSRRDATDRIWELVTSPVVFPDSQDQHVILVVRDITGVVKLQELVRQSELMSAMGELVGNVAHEVRNPLFSISATLDAFEVHSANRKEYQKYRVVLRRELSRLNQMMQELLDYGKPASLNLSKSNIVDVMRDAVQSCLAQARSAAAKIKVDVSGPIADLEMDRVRMFQVFQNLIQNALQHSPPGSVISLQAKHCHDDGRPWIECTVEDCGSGFRAQDLPKVFTPFFSRRREGTGLGLPLARRIVQQHGGTISAGNRKEGGAVIKVRIPAFDWKTPDPQLASLSVH